MSDQIPLARSSTITNIVSLNSQLFSPPNTQLIFYRTNSIDTVVFPSPASFCGQWFINNSYPINLLPSILVVPSSLIPTVYLSSSIILGLFIEPDNSYPSVLTHCFSTDYYSLLLFSTLYVRKYITQIAMSSSTYINYQLIQKSILPVEIHLLYPSLSSHGKYSNGEESHLLA